MSSTNIEIDQSLKLERTEKDTAISFSNKVSGTILIRARDKREIQRVFRAIGRPKVFVYKLFAILIFILIKDHLKEINQITIDDEYPGKEHLIRNYLFQEIKKIKPDFPAENIIFRRIGKKSKAHYLAHGVTGKKKPADKVVTLGEILRFLIKE